MMYVRYIVIKKYFVVFSPESPAFTTGKLCLHEITGHKASMQLIMDCLNPHSIFQPLFSLSMKLVLNNILTLRHERLPFLNIYKYFFTLVLQPLLENLIECKPVPQKLHNINNMYLLYTVLLYYTQSILFFFQMHVWKSDTCN